MKYPSDEWWDRMVWNLSLVALGFALGLLAGEARAQDAVGIIGPSYHGNTSAGYRNDTFGAYYKRDVGNNWFQSVGAYKNSLGDVSVFVGGGRSHPLVGRLSASWQIGFVSGYPIAPIAPFGVASVDYKLTQNDAVRVAVLPPLPEKTNSWVFTLVYERRLK